MATTIEIYGAQGPRGRDGTNGTDATVTQANVQAAITDKPAFRTNIGAVSGDGTGITDPAAFRAAIGVSGTESVSAGPFHNDLDAENGGVDIGFLYRAVSGATQWRKDGFHPMQLSPGLWLDPSQLALADGANVTSVTDLSGNSRTATNSGTAPTFEASGPNGMPWIVSPARTLVTPSFDHFPAKRGTWFVVYRPSTTVALNQTFFGSLTGGTAPGWLVYNNNEITDRYLFAGAFGTSPARLQGDRADEVVVRGIRRTSDTAWDWWRGPLKQWEMTLADVALAANPFKIGQLFNGRIGEVLFFPSALSDDDMEKVAGYLTAKWAAGRAVNLVFEGDSQTQGANILANADQDTYPAKVFGLIGDSRVAIWNAGTGSAQWATLTARATDLDERVVSYAQNVLVVWCGTNEVGANNAPVSIAAAASYLAARRTAGWQNILVLTAMDRTDASNEPWRTAYNAGLRNLCEWHGYTLVDIAEDPDLGVAGAFADTDFFQVDGIHLNSGGTSVAAGLVHAALDPLI